MINSIQQFGENGVKRLADIFDSYTINPHPWVPQNKRNRHFQAIPIDLNLDI